MTIQVTDIQLLASERLTDTDDGGGKMTGNVIASGQVNNLFPDISRLDRTYGRLSLRKAFMAVRSQTTDAYLGSHVIVTDAPADSKVAVTLFTTNDDSDERIDAEDRIESYLTAGPLSAFYLYGNQPLGAKAISLLGRVEAPVPNVGDVLVLSVESNGVVASQQYVRISDVAAAAQTFTDSQGDYTRNVITLTITSALLATYLGAEASRLSGVTPPTLVRTAVVADASTYYGISKLSAAVAANSLQVTIDSISAQLVPATTREVAVAGATPGLSLSHIAAGVAQALSTGSSPRYQLRGVLPGSLQASVSGGTATDDGAGNIVLAGNDVGTVDYDSGLLSGITINGGTYIPSASYSNASYTYSQAITLNSQGTVYVATLPSIPAPGTLAVAFRYLGKWYSLQDTGDGTIAGDSASAGGGKVDYTTGNVTLTLGAIPDVGSRLIFVWGDPTSFQQHAGDVTVSTPVISFQVQHWPIKPGSVSLSWVSAGATKAATVDSNGNITGNGTGNVRYLDGTVILVPAAGAYPDSNAQISITYTQAAGMKSSVTGSFSAGLLSFQLPAQTLPLVAGAISGAIAGTYQDLAYTLYWKDDGAGNIVSAPELSPKSASLQIGASMSAPIITVASGSINYTTGAVTITPGSIAINVFTTVGFNTVPSGPSYAMVLKGDWLVQQGTPNFVPTPLVQFNAKTDTAAETPQIEAVDYPGVSFVISPTVSDPVLPGSVWFTWGGKTYVDRQGYIFRDISPTTGSGTQAGTIDYATGTVTLTNYGTSTGGNVSLISLLTQNGIMPTSYVVFRTPGSPLRPASFYVQAIRTDTGATISATSDNNGNISGTGILGTVDNQMGWAEISFGEYVVAAGNENEPWYNAASIVGANVWKPLFVDPSTIKFNCVVQTTLPLDASLLGIDPVRLPLDGTVPIFRDGNVVVIHDDRVAQLPSNFGAGSTFQLPDFPVTQCALVDATGTPMDISNYTVDTDTGVVTGTSTWSAAGLTAPIDAAYTVEDMALASSVELTGLITLSAPLSRNYPAGAKISSALLFGDLQATNAVFFSQATWTGVWSDTPIGAGTTAQYNRTTYPLEIENANAISQRFALIFTSAAGGNIVGETLGQIGTFTTGTDTAPINPITGQPYFTLLKDGWGSGWGVNNVLRFDMTGAAAPIWIARTILPGAVASSQDGFDIQMRGDVE